MNYTFSVLAARPRRRDDLVSQCRGLSLKDGR